MHPESSNRSFLDNLELSFNSIVNGPIWEAERAHIPVWLYMTANIDFLTMAAVSLACETFWNCMYCGRFCFWLLSPDLLKLHVVIWVPLEHLFCFREVVLKSLQCWIAFIFTKPEDVKSWINRICVQLFCFFFPYYFTVNKLLLLIAKFESFDLVEKCI